VTTVVKVFCWYLFFYAVLAAAWYYTSVWLFGKVLFSEDYTFPAISMGAVITAMYVVGALNKRKRGTENG